MNRDATQQALTCRASCLLTFAAQRFYWYKNGQYLEKYKDEINPFLLRNAEEGSYSCSVHGYNSIRTLPLCEYSFLS